MLATSSRIELELRGARLTLRAPRLADAEAIVEGIGAFAVSRMLAMVPHPYRRSDAESWIYRSLREVAAGEALHFVILAEGKVAGVVSLARGWPAPNFGYWLAIPYWGRGYATEAGRLVLRHGFERAGLRLVRSGVFADNPASLHVQEKLGFVALGVSRVWCLACGARVPHIDTALSRERFLEFAA
ncbi:MAG: GNAT family N-acetyltransferase [Bauldia sp.]|nr:GNAT family N-acetyltransferase [Bauldia sp.]